MSLARHNYFTPLTESLGATIIGGIQELAERISDPAPDHVIDHGDRKGRYEPITLPPGSAGSHDWEQHGEVMRKPRAEPTSNKRQVTKPGKSNIVRMLINLVTQDIFGEKINTSYYQRANWV